MDFRLDVSSVPNLEDSLVSPNGTIGLLSPRVSEGRLFVHVISFTVPWPTQWKSGFYCIMMVEKQNSRTATVEAHPDYSSGKRATVVWGQRFNFDFTQENAEFQISVWGRGYNKVVSKIIEPMLKLKVADLPPDQSVKREFKFSDKSTLILKFIRTPIVKRKITENEFEKIKIIGRGSFGTVLLVRKKETGCLYAMKVLHKKNIIERNAVRHAIAERTVLKNINHPFLVHLKYAFQNPEHLFMVIDYLNGGELFFHLQQEDAFSEERSKFYAAEIVLALGYLHDNGIMYRDLKPENILLDMEGHVCIVDFGLCKTGLGFDSKTGTFCGSLEYMAPEVLEGKEYTKDIDWWALATMVYEMIEGIPPFWDEDSEVMIVNIAKCNISDLLKTNNKFSKECKDFIKMILQTEPTKRLGYGENGTQDIKNHPWFADIDWIKLYNKQIEPLFKPHLEHESDTRYFDEEVTSEDPHLHNFDVPVNHRSELEDDPFDDFSFEEPFTKDPSFKPKTRRTRAIKNNSRPIQENLSRSEKSYNNEHHSSKYKNSLITDNESQVMLDENNKSPRKESTSPRICLEYCNNSETQLLTLSSRVHIKSEISPRISQKNKEQSAPVSFEISELELKGQSPIFISDTTTTNKDSLNKEIIKHVRKTSAPPSMTDFIKMNRPSFGNQNSLYVSSENVRHVRSKSGTFVALPPHIETDYIHSPPFSRSDFEGADADKQNCVIS